MNDQDTRNVLRAAGERLGAMAEEAKLTYDRYVGQRGARQTAGKFYQRYARLSRLSAEVLKVADEA